MSDPAIYDEDTRLVVALGSDAHVGPKLSVKVVLVTGLTLLFFSMGFYLSLPASESKTGLDLIYLIGMIAFCVILQHEYHPRLRQFGLSREVLRSRRTIIWIVAGLALAGVNLAFRYGPVFFVSLIDPSPHTLTPGLRPYSRIVRQPFDLLLAGVIGPFLEELLFRGYLYLVFRQNWGRRWAALISSAVFAACHLWNGLFAAEVFFASLLDIYLDNKARSLAPSIAAHTSYNLILSVIRFTPT